VPVRATNYQLFISRMIKAGISGNTSARRLVVDFLLGLQAREKPEEAERETESESPEVVSWDVAKARLLKDASRLRTED
jgi:hypothetical protein